MTAAWRCLHIARRADSQRRKAADGAQAPGDGDGGQVGGSRIARHDRALDTDRRTYFGRVTKPHILAAVREAVSIEAAERMADMKKQDTTYRPPLHRPEARPDDRGKRRA